MVNFNQQRLVVFLICHSSHSSNCYINSNYKNCIKHLFSKSFKYPFKYQPLKHRIFCIFLRNVLTIYMYVYICITTKNRLLWRRYTALYTFTIFSISHYYTNKFFSNLNRAFAQNKFSSKPTKVYLNQWSFQFL